MSDKLMNVKRLGIGLYLRLWLLRLLGLRFELEDKER